MEEKEKVVAEEMPAAPAPKKVNKKGVVFDCFLNLRKRPSFDAEIEAVIPNGSYVTILSGKDGSFYKVSYNGIEGYCSKEYITEVK